MGRIIFDNILRNAEAWQRSVIGCSSRQNKKCFPPHPCGVPASKAVAQPSLGVSNSQRLLLAYSSDSFESLMLVWHRKHLPPGYAYSQELAVTYVFNAHAFILVEVSEIFKMIWKYFTIIYNIHVIAVCCDAVMYRCEVPDHLVLTCTPYWSVKRVY